MLRRDFLRTGAIIIGGMMILPDFAVADIPEEKNRRPGPTARTCHLHGHARSGCASRPEIAPFLEKGLAILPNF